jgi:adenosylcobinamide kinase/adenosylcobinamide-phosphate guanylyltransferase
MGHLVLILGGARSGKSAYALTLGERYPEPRAFLATAEALDQEMAERIERHRRTRPSSWKTIEEPLKIVEALEGLEGHYGVIVLDCLTLWLSNLLGTFHHDGAMMRGEIERLAEGIAHLLTPLIVVTNEVGLGIVPEHPTARLFRDLVGFANGELARVAEEVYLMFAGLPLRLK